MWHSSLERNRNRIKKKKKKTGHGAAPEDCCEYFDEQMNSPVETATAAINTDGIPAKMTTTAAMKQMFLAVEGEMEDSVL